MSTNKNKWILNNSAGVQVNGNIMGNRYYMVGTGFLNSNGDQTTLEAIAYYGKSLVLGANTTYTSNANQWQTAVRGKQVIIQANGTGDSGKQRDIALFDRDGVTISGTFTVTQNIYAKGFYESSDERLKENILPINYLGDIPFKQFNFKSDENKTIKYGVIAQDLEKMGLNNLVSISGNGMKTVDYISLLCMAVENLQQRVEELEHKLSSI